MAIGNVSSSNISSSKEFSEFMCIRTTSGSVNYAMFFMANVLLMCPVCVLVLHLGVRQWWQQRSTTTAAKTRHSDIFIYNLAVMELMAVLGYGLGCVGLWVNRVFFTVGLHLWNFPWYAEMLFYTLTCVEHYLAVVHPITYLSLRSERGIRIRNICVGCVWLFSLVGASLLSAQNISKILNYHLLTFAMVVISFCSISVLITLIRPGPGEKPGDRGTSDQSKKKAFKIVMVILGVVSVRLLSALVWILFSEDLKWGCFVLNFVLWLNLPCTLMLPSLLLHRSGTFKSCTSPAF